MNKNEDLMFIEECFKNIKLKKNMERNLKAISRTVHRIYDINMEITIVNNTNNKFFGMVIYPNKTAMDSLLEVILSGDNKKSSIRATIDVWSKNKDWYMEIDSILLYDRNLNSNPTELTAALIHEIGHIVYSNTIPQRITKVIKFELLKINYKLRTLCSNERMRGLFKLAIIEACVNKSYSYINKDSERDADRFVIKSGYADALNNLITKLIRATGNSIVDKSVNDMEKDVSIIVKWSIDNIGELQMRKTKLKQSIDVQILKTPSLFVKSILKTIKSSFIDSSSDLNVFKKILSESGQNLNLFYNRIAEESLLNFFSRGKVKKISQLDIDIIGVEIDKIENSDDKIYVLDLIYEKLELIRIALEMLEDKPNANKVTQSKVTLLGFKKQLDSFRKDALAAKISDKRYGLFIKYPEGYEG